MGRIFGTDGVRGVANGDLTIQLATDIGDVYKRQVCIILSRERCFMQSHIWL